MLLMDQSGEGAFARILDFVSCIRAFITNHNAGTTSKLTTFVTLTLDANNIALFPGYTFSSHFSDLENFVGSPFSVGMQSSVWTIKC